MIALEPQDCIHARLTWDRFCHAWRCLDCQEIPYMADQISESWRDLPEQLPDLRPVTDDDFIRLPRQQGRE